MPKPSANLIFTVLIIVIMTLLAGCGRQISQNNPAPTSPAANLPAGNSVKDSGWKTYIHPGYGFSFEYPDDWNVSSFAEGDGETVLIQNLTPQPPFERGAEGGYISGGIQIYISMFDEPDTALTKERILQDIPDLKIENDKQIKIAGFEALSFESVSQSGEATKEAWFVHNSFFYQISAGVGSEEILNKMIETWKFN